MALQVAILGSVEPRLDGDVVGVPAGKQRALLTLLAVHAPDPVAAEHAAEALWPRAAPAEALRSLQVTVSRLRRSLGAAGSALETAASGYRLAVAADAVDAWRFETLMTEAQEARVEGDGQTARRLLDDALGLWRGPALADARYESFAQTEIARLEELRLAALEERIDARLSQGEHAFVVAELERLSAEHPSRERLVGLLMLALYRCGRQTDALEVYTRSRRRLDEELGLEPSPELQHLQEAILRHDASLELRGEGGWEARRGSIDPGQPPAGVVTMLFTEIEGSTQLWERDAAAMARALARHDELLRGVIEEHGGHVFKTVGDAFCAAFAGPRDAVAAARAGQAALTAEPWPDGARLRVRMAVHLGECEQRDGDFFGAPVNRVARLLAVGHGGQVLLSGVVAELAGEQARLRDLGEHRLKDLGRPEHVFQLLAPGLDEDFPPLRSLGDPRLRHNLPEQPSTLIGREREIADVAYLLRRTRLVTLTGAGGAGKTRLALQAAAELLDGSGEGVWLIELAPLTAAEHVAPAACAVLGLREDPGRPALERLVEYLADRAVLLVLDNCEHLVEAAAQLAGALLRSCSRVVLLATSREALRVDGEHAYRVPSLGVPAAGDLALDSVLASDAVRLIRDRARQVDHEFALDAGNAALCGAICRQLDGMPLAIELAAARLRSMSLSDVHDRLDRRLSLLTRGSRSAMPRQQTLRATVDWSYRLLDESERALLARLSVFAGGFDFAAAEEVGAGAAGDVLDQLDSLIDKSLVQAERRDGAMRYRLLETMRQYAAERLAASGAAQAAQRAHAEHYLALAERADPPVMRDEHLAWLDRLDDEHENLRAALGFLLGDPSDAGPALRLASALLWWWDIRGQAVSGGQLAERAIAHPGFDAAPPADRARTLLGAGHLAVARGEYEHAGALLARASEIAQEAGEPGLAAVALRWASFAEYSRGNRDDFARLIEEALALALASGDPQVEAQVLSMSMYHAGKPHGANFRAMHRSLDLLTELGDLRWTPLTLNNLGNEELSAGDVDAARAHLEESARLARLSGSESTLCYALSTLVLACVEQDELAAAEAHLDEVAERAARLGYLGITPYILLGHALLASRERRHELAATLHGAADAELRRFGAAAFDDAETRLLEPDRERLRAALGDAEFERLAARGSTLGPQQAIALARTAGEG